MDKKIKKFIPDEQRVLVLPDESGESKTESGIIIPSAEGKDKPLTGIIIEVGKGNEDIPMRYKQGEKVLFSNYAGIEINLVYGKIKGLNTYRVMNQMDIMGRIIKE